MKNERNKEMSIEPENLRQENKEFYRMLTITGIPMVIQQVISITLNLVDTIMVGRISEEALAAVGAANQVYFIFGIIVFGIFSGASVLAVQYWGIGDQKTLRNIVGIDYTMCLAMCIIGTALAYFCAPFFIGVFSDDPAVLELGVGYLRIACFSYIFAGLTFVILYNSRAIKDLKYPTIINSCAILLNIVLNYLLIYGKLGLPELGVNGAAVATLIARILECIAMFLSVYLRKSHPLKAGPREMFSYSGELFIKVIKTAIPVIASEGLWALSVTSIFAIYGKISAAALAVSQIAGTVTDFFQAVYFGLGNAAAVLVGGVLGQGKKAQAYRYSKNIIKITCVLNVVMTVILILTRMPIAWLYDYGPETTQLIIDALLVYAVAMSPKMFSYMVICAIFRAGGDTVYSMIVDVAFNLGGRVPLAFIGVFILKWPLAWVMALVAAADFTKVIFVYRRYRSRKWMNVLTGMEEAE